MGRERGNDDQVHQLPPGPHGGRGRGQRRLLLHDVRLRSREHREEELRLLALLRREGTVRGLLHGPAGGLGRGALLAGLRHLQHGARRADGPGLSLLSDVVEERVRAHLTTRAVDSSCSVRLSFYCTLSCIVLSSGLTQTSLRARSTTEATPSLAVDA